VRSGSVSGRSAKNHPDPILRIGCSGWQYAHWRGDFYPAGLPTTRWLSHYAGAFDTVELNNSFYRLPSPEAFGGWRARTPAGFLFAVKASRFLTHMKKLKDPVDPLARFFDAARELGPKLGPILYQLPPRFPVNLDRLRTFLHALPPGFRHVMEFRDASWYAPEVLAALQSAGVALCLHDMSGSATDRMRVGPFVYVRFHGVTRYGGRYDDERLAGWADWLAEEHGAGRDVFAYFNNDVGGHAPRDAARLREMMAGPRGPAPAARRPREMPPPPLA
jgi:uncharacterized protein YecE (DUF72 family)